MTDTSTKTLSDSQVEAWQRDGFLVLDDCVAAGSLDALRAAYDEILSKHVEASGDRMLGGITRQVMLPSAAHATFDRNPVVGNGIRIGRQLFGTDDVIRTFDMLIYKPPNHPHDTPWHQDMAYVKRPFAPPGTKIVLESIQFWVPLDAGDGEYGCMQFVRGYHTRPLLDL